MQPFTVAERSGFEPEIRFCRIHAFQACLLSHSSISPEWECKYTLKPREMQMNLFDLQFGRVNDQVQHDVKLQQTFKELVFGCGKN